MPLPAVDVDQFEPGELKVEQTTIPFPGLTVCRTRSNLGVRVKGDVAGGTALVALLGDGETSARWSGVSFGKENVAASHSTVDLLSRGRATFYTMTVDRNAVPCEFVRFDPLRADRLRGYLERLVRVAQRHGTQAVGRFAGETVLTCLSLVAGEAKNGGRPMPHRVAAVRRCEEYLSAHIDESPTLVTLSGVSGLRPRSLINAFHAVTGYSPMVYLKVQRLNAVYRALRSADPDETRIIDVAANYGFWHMGHFAADYRAMFGETPSQTLRK